LIDRVIINRYAFAVAHSFQEFEYQPALEDIETLKVVLSDNSDLLYILQTDLTSENQKIELIELVTNKLNLKTIWQNLFFIMIKNSRFFLILPVIVATRREIYIKQGKLPILLNLARQQDDETLPEILEYLKKIIHKDIIPEIEYDETLIGGFRAETDDMVIDGSIRNNLQRFIKMSRKNLN
jgi:ATP synthase F1 delta subunit